MSKIDSAIVESDLVA